MNFSLMGATTALLEGSKRPSSFPFFCLMGMVQITVPELNNKKIKQDREVDGITSQPIIFKFVHCIFLLSSSSQK